MITIEKNIPIPADAYEKKVGKFARITSIFFNLSATLGINQGYAKLTRTLDSTMVIVEFYNEKVDGSRKLTTHILNNTKILSFGAISDEFNVRHLEHSINVPMIKDYVNNQGIRTLIFDFKEVFESKPSETFLEQNGKTMSKDIRNSIHTIFKELQVDQLTKIDNIHVNMRRFINSLVVRYKKNGKQFVSKQVGNEIFIKRVK